MYTLAPHCPLFARKFAANTTQAIIAVFSDCEAGLQILAPQEGPCPGTNGTRMPPLNPFKGPVSRSELLTEAKQRYSRFDSDVST